MIGELGDAAESDRPARRPRPRGESLLSRMRLTQQLALVSALVALVAVVAALGAVGWGLRANAADRFAAELGRTQRTLVRLQERASDQALWTATLVGESPEVRAAMETYRVESAHASPGQRDALLSTLQRGVADQLYGLQQSLMVVVGLDGRVLAASARQATAPAVGESMARVPAVAHALDPQAPVDSANLGMVRLREGYYGIAAAPILLDGYTVGAVVLGDRIDQTYVRDLQTAFDGEIVVLAGGRTIGSTLPASLGVDTLLGRAAPGSGGRARTVRTRDGEYVVAALPLGETEAGEAVTLFLLHSVTRAVNDLMAPLTREFLFFGLAGAILAAVAAGLATRSVVAPLQRIVAAMRAGARTGAVKRTAPPAGAPREIRWLADSYAQLGDALEAEREAVARRTRELEATNAALSAQVHERERAERTLEERETQLRQAQKLEAVGTLAGGVAHDFNNLLTIITGYTQMALTQLPADAPAAADMREVKGAAQRATQLTQQLLAFGRKQVLEPRVIDLNGVIADVEPMLRRLVGEHVEIRATLDPTVSRTLADPVQMEQVIMNLAVNARDAMPDGGELSISTTNVAPGTVAELDGRPGVAIVVRDEGIGMDAATRERIFEPFFTTKAPGRGTGLGLATVYGIVKQSGGAVAVASAPGKGSEFRVVLPAVSATESDLVAAIERAVPRGSETILLVEDEDGVRVLAERVLSRAGYRVLTASRGSDALAIASRHGGAIELLLTDVVMPQMTGPELARRLAELRPMMRVLFMSGHSEDAVALHGRLGGAGFVRKPFEPDDIVRIVRETLDSSAGVVDEVA